MASEEEIQAQYSTLRIIIFAMMVFSPVIYLIIVYVLLKKGERPTRPNEAIFYLLLSLAALQGALVPLIEKKVRHTYYSGWSAGRTVLEAAGSIVIVRLGLIGAIYIYGLVIFFITGIASRLPYFYAFGVFYTIVYWPAESRFRDLIEQLEAK